MSNFSIGLLTTAVEGFSKTSPEFGIRFSPSNFDPLLTPTIGSISVSNINLLGTETIPGFITGRRPLKGQVYPRGVYNK